MTALACPSCGNAQQWAAVVVDGSGIRADCGRCGQVVRSAGASGSSVAMGDVTVTGPAVFGEGSTVVGRQRPSPRPKPRPAAEPRYEVEDGQRYLVIDGRRWAVREPAAPSTPPRPAAEPRYEVEDGQRYLVIDGRRWAVREPAAPSATPPPSPVPQRSADNPAEAGPVAPSVDPYPRPEDTSPSPWSSPQSPRPATAHVPSEITGLVSAQRYAQGMSTALDGHAPIIEIFVGVLRESEVSGDAVACAMRAQELTGQASQAWRAADSALARQHAVRDAYASVPEAGTKSWLQQG